MSGGVRIAGAAGLRDGDGVRFRFELDGLSYDAFAVRWRGRVHAYVNACRHQSLPLDSGDARFFDGAFDALVCRHHGARFAPDTGRCVDGPCEGASLTALGIEERGGELWCTGRAGRRAAPGQ